MLSRKVGGRGALMAVMVSDCDAVSTGNDGVIVMESGVVEVGVVANDSVICIWSLFDVLDVFLLIVCLFVVVLDEYLICLPFSITADILIFLYGVVCTRIDWQTPLMNLVLLE